MSQNNELPNDILAELAAMNQQVVARSGSMEWTRGQLDALFERVRPAENWKNRIDAVVTLADDREMIGTREAVIFFTGSVPTFEPRGRNRYRVRAAGYYATIGA